MIQDDKSVSAKETIRLSPFTQPSASGTETPSSVKCRNVVGDSIARIQLYAARRQKMCQRWLLMGHKPLYNYEIDCWSSSGHHAKFWMKFISRRWTSAASSVVLGCQLALGVAVKRGAPDHEVQLNCLKEPKRL